MTKKTGADSQLDFEIRFFERLICQKPDFVDALIPLAEAYTRRGWHRKGLEIDRRLSELLKDDPIVYYNLACSWALTGETEKAFEALRQSVRLGYRDFAYLRRDPDLESLHNYPGFKKLIDAKAVHER